MTTKHIPHYDIFCIEQLSANYAFRCDAQKYRGVSALFSEDAVWDETVIGVPICEGRKKIHDYFTSMEQANLEYLVHINSNHRVTSYDGDTAAGTVHLHAEGVLDGNLIRIFGYYADEYVRVDGAWLFKKRKLFEIAPTTSVKRI